MRYRMKRALATMWITSASAMKDLDWSPKISIREGLDEVYTTDIAPLLRQET
jgi:nucleoside-diphosphate-sugar epimerase